MAKRSVVAQHKIITSDPDAPVVFSGQYTKQGEPILRKQVIEIEPRTLFEMDDTDPDFNRLIESEAIRLATDLEAEYGKTFD
ncbi:hypothetical protein [Novosphingobium mathurense]|uniref:Uncharacterized protein n=1 Tax=Novosphingobium mathurense TaxID=428990 RepID=A0A1U6GY54_9SPHN|nr:hypothetical protein [Novosphingobium mathurense]SLJ88360.1 hypothetical protein SAMN06295987_101795 [Novosphingobium mathurense]